MAKKLFEHLEAETGKQYLCIGKVHGRDSNGNLSGEIYFRKPLTPSIYPGMAREKYIHPGGTDYGLCRPGVPLGTGELPLHEDDFPYLLCAMFGRNGDTGGQLTYDWSLANTRLGVFLGARQSLQTRNPDFVFKPFERDWTRASETNRHIGDFVGSCFKNTVKLYPGVEEAACRAIQKQVAEGLLEIAYTAFEHWNFKKQIYEQAKVTGENAEQAQAALNAKKTAAATNAATAATELVALEGTIAAELAKGGTSITETLKICEKYLAGEFCKDWFIRGFIKENLWPDKFREQEAHLDSQRAILHAHQAGSTEHHFNTASLKPFFKANPRLAALYTPNT